MPHFSETGADMVLCQVCGGDYDSSKVEMNWRPDITKKESAGNVCEDCVKNFEKENLANGYRLNNMEGQLSDPQAISKFIKAGNAHFTIRSKQTGVRFTYRVSRAKNQDTRYDKPAWFVGVLTGSDNNSCYTYIGLLDQNGFRQTKGSQLKAGAPSVVAFTWMFKNVERGILHDQMEFWHEGRCGRCGKKLTVPESIADGYGPECVRIMNPKTTLSSLMYLKADPVREAAQREQEGIY